MQSKDKQRTCFLTDVTLLNQTNNSTSVFQTQAHARSRRWTTLPKVGNTSKTVKIHSDILPILSRLQLFTAWAVTGRTRNISEIQQINSWNEMTPVLWRDRVYKANEGFLFFYDLSDWSVMMTERFGETGWTAWQTGCSGITRELRHLTEIAWIMITPAFHVSL